MLVNGLSSQWYTGLSGVPDGSVLGPVLFVLYIHALIEVVDNSELFLFVDNNKLLSIIFKDEDSAVLQASIEAMFKWTRNSLLFFHPDKCFTMIFRFKSKPRLKFSHISEKVNKANQIMHLIL